MEYGVTLTEVAKALNLSPSEFSLVYMREEQSAEVKDKLFKAIEIASGDKYDDSRVQKN